MSDGEARDGTPSGALSAGRRVASSHATEGGVGLVVALTVFFVALGLAVGLFTMSNARTKAVVGQRELADGLALTESAVNHALFEINSRVDIDGGGLGGVGIGEPARLGHGEYRAVSREQGEDVRVVVVAAIPTFEGAELLSAAAALLSPKFPFDPEAAAVSVSGDVGNTRFEFQADATVLIDGTEDGPAFMLSDGSTADNLFEAMSKNAKSAEQLEDGIELTHASSAGGSVTILGDQSTLTTSEVGKLGELDVPTALDAPTLKQEVLQSFHDSFNDRIAELSAQPSVTKVTDTALTGDYTFGTAAAPAVVVISPSGSGGKLELDGTIQGHGILVIGGELVLHDKDHDGSVPGIDWKGQVIVTGVGEGGKARRAELTNWGGDVHIDGSLALVGSGDGGQVRLMGDDHRLASSPDGGAGGSGSGGDFVINGALLALAGTDAKRKDTVDVWLKHGSLTVNGVFAVLGSRVSVRVDGDKAGAGAGGGDSDPHDDGDGQPSLSVNGTFASAVPDQSGADKLQFSFKRNAVAEFLWDESQFRLGMGELDELVGDLGVVTRVYELTGYVGNFGGAVGLAEVEAAIAEGATGLDPSGP
jgi:hypothetical protein